MFKGVSQCLPTVDVLYFGLLTPSITLPCPFTSHLHFQQLSIHILISSTFTSYVMWDYRCSVIFFPSLPELYRVVPLLNHVLYLNLYYHTCYCVHVYLSSTWQKTSGFCVSDPGLLCFNMMSSNCIHLLSNCMSLFLMSLFLLVAGRRMKEGD
jgi:hypothetical protein